MRGKLLAGFAIAALLAAGCGQDAAGPGKVESPGGPLPVSQIGDPALADTITAQLRCLYQPPGLLPNASSSTGKFEDIKTKLAAGDLQGALDATANLVRFIELKWSQYDGPPTINCDPPLPAPYTNPVSIEVLKNDVITNLWRYVGLTGEVCQVPAGQPKFCRPPDQTTGFVYFPGNISDQITYVSIEEDPPLLQNLFDEYFHRVRIVTLPLSDFGGFQLKPLVVVCFNGGVVPSDNSILARLLVGSKHNGEVNFLPRADLNATYGAEVLQEAVSTCGGAGPSAPAFSSRTAFGRWGNRLLDLLLPKALLARQSESFGGVGGSAEQFSDFGVVDPGMNASGGVGGSAEQFAPPAGAPTASGPAASTYDDGSSTVTGQAGETACLAGNSEPTCNTTGGLPSVKVVAPAHPTVGIPGVSVSFALLDPTGPGHSPSSATLCAGQTTVTTGPDGVATLPCLHFGPTLGYKKLRATLNPTTVDPLACIVDGLTCTPSSPRNFLVQTTPGDPKYVMTYMPPASPPTTPPFPQSYPYPGTPPAFVDVNPSPQAIVTDAYYNGVPGVQIVWTPNTINGSTVNGGATTATTTSGPGGLSSVTWNLGDGSNLLSADISGTVSGAQPAQFIANTPTGVPGFTCALGGSKTDLGFLSIKRPTNTIKTINLWMSVTGQSDFLHRYGVTVTVHTGIPTSSNKVGEKAGGIVQLPGNNGNPTAVSFTLTDLVFPTETNGTQAVWFKFQFTDLPATRKIQVWYQNTTFRSNQACYDSKAYAPGSTTTFKRGLSINVTN